MYIYIYIYVFFYSNRFIHILSQSMSHVRLGSIDWTTPHTYHIYTGDLSQTYATNIKYVSLSEDIPSDMTWVIHDNHPAGWETARGKSTFSAFGHASFFQISGFCDLFNWLEHRFAPQFQRVWKKTLQFPVTRNHIAEPEGHTYWRSMTNAQPQNQKW